jgi:hypothetical protein
VTAAGTSGEVVQARWSDAARKAALDARRHSAAALDEPLKRSMDGKPRADLNAYSKTKAAHTASKKTATETGKGGYDQDSHNYAESQHRYAADAHEKAGGSYMAALHNKAADAHKAASIQIHKETWAAKASDATPAEDILESIYARAETVTAGAPIGNTNASKHANGLSDIAREKSTVAHGFGGKPAGRIKLHEDASNAHYEAAGAHEKAVEHEVEPERRKFHQDAAAYHHGKVDHHENQAVKINQTNRGADASTLQSIYARAGETA